MNKHNFSKYISLYVLFTLYLLSGCNLSDFGDMNENQNAPTEINTKYMLTSALTSSSSYLGDTDQNIFVQYFTETQYPFASTYRLDGIRYSLFASVYRDILRKLKLIIEANKDKETKEKAVANGPHGAQIAIAEIFSCYFFQLLTDLVGPIPYSQAVAGGKYNFQPKYDNTDTVYKDMFKRLDAAIKLIDGILKTNPNARVEGDVLFMLAPDPLSGWKRFANMLRATMAMRISDAEPALAKAEFLKAKDGLITSNFANIGFQFMMDPNFENPWYFRFRSRSDFAISNTFVDFLKARKDQRLFKIAEKTGSLADKTGFAAYNGLRYGVGNAILGSIPKDSYSYPSKDGVRKRDAKLFYYTYAQALFLQAEAVHKGWYAGNAKQLYENAIKASFEQWGVLDIGGYYATYLAHPKVKWDATKAQQLLGEQKWAALFLQGYESYASWRRLDFPKLTPAQDAVNESKTIPVRQLYPETEDQRNSDQYKKALKDFLGGKDVETTKLWWDKK